MKLDRKRRGTLKVCHVCKEEKPHASWKAYTCDECLSAGLKWCRRCESVQPIDNFHKNGNTLRSICKQCEVEESHSKKKENGYYDRPEVREARNKTSAEYKRRMYANDEEYRLNEIIRCHERRVSAGKPITTAEWLECVEAFDNSCAYCGAQRNLTMEHVIAIANGGTNSVDNIIPACRSCNSSKGTKELIEWYTSQPFYSKDRLSNIIKYLRAKGGDANAKQD